MINDDIISKYRECKNMKKTARELNVSFGVVRKTLITAGLYSSPKTELIKEYANIGASDADIAKALNMSIQTINAHRPYRRGTYLDQNKTINAVNIKKHRENKKKKAQELKINNNVLLI